MGTSAGREDRGTPLGIWRDADADTAVARFESWPGATRHDVVSMPIGWTMLPHPTCGVIVRGPALQVGTAAQVVEWARTGRHGFRFRETDPA
jgi:hypothetical protein